jgi:hypothetical protein
MWRGVINDRSEILNLSLAPRLKVQGTSIYIATEFQPVRYAHPTTRCGGARRDDRQIRLPK